MVRAASSVLLLGILLTSAILWWPLADIFIVGSDDEYLMRSSARLAAGDWRQLLLPQAVHILPLYKLARAYFDLHFPEGFVWMHVITVAAHLASVVLLFILSRHHLRTAEAALAVAFLFGWHAGGWQAMVIRSQNTFVWSLPFVLGAVACATRIGGERGRRWAAGCFLCLLAVAGLHSLAGLAAMPGVLAAYYLLGRPSGSGMDRWAWAATLVPAAAAATLWVVWCLPGLNLDHHFQQFPQTREQRLRRVAQAARGTVLHFGYQVRRGTPTPLVLITAALGLSVLLALGRKQAGSRFLLAALALTVVPAFVTFLLRTDAGWGVSRYNYQSFLAAAVAAGAAADLLLQAVRNRPRLRWFLLAVLLCATPAWWTPKKWFERQAELVFPGPSLRKDYWLGWRSFLDRMAAESARAGGDFRLPSLDLADQNTADVFDLIYPRGKPGIVVVTVDHRQESDCVEFWRKARELRAAGLPGSMVIRTPHQAVPPGEHLDCVVAAREGAPLVLARED